MIIYYDTKNQFELTDEEFKNALPAFEQGKNVWVERLQVHLTPFYKWAGKKSVFSNTEGYLHDGGKVVKRFGVWVLADNPEIRIDPHYYPEIVKDEVLAENPKALKQIT